MELRGPTGAVVTVSDDRATRFIAAGYTEVKGNTAGDDAELEAEPARPAPKRQKRRRGE